MAEYADYEVDLIRTLEILSTSDVVARATAAGKTLTESTIRTYRSTGRGNLPEPDLTIGKTPGWLAQTIDPWIARLPGRGARTDLQRTVTVQDIAVELGDPDLAEKFARSVGAFTAHDPRTGQLPKPWHGQGMNAMFTRAEADQLIAEWERAANNAESGSYLTYGRDPEVEEVADRYRSGH